METNDKKATERPTIWQYLVLILLVMVLTIIVLTLLGPSTGNVFSDILMII